MNQPNATKTESPAAKIKWARINDYTQYDSRNCNNGGAYGFWTEYRFIGSNVYEIVYGTTANFEFCNYCNSFSCHCDKVAIVVSDAEVWEEIRKAEADQSEAITAEYELFESADEWKEKLRRRVRDSLNKTTDERAIIKCAVALDVKLE